MNKDLEARLRAHREALDAEVGPRAGMEARIMARATATAAPGPRQASWLRELAVAALVLIVAGAAGVGVIRLRAAHQAVVVHSPAPTANASASATASPAPTLPSKLSYIPGVKVQPGPIEIGSVYTDTPLRMFTPLRGWAVGPAGKGNSGDHDGLLLTVDGGNHWRNVTPPGSSGWSDRTNFFLDLGHAWVAATPHAVYHPTRSAVITVYRTTDGAQSWQSSTLEVADGSPSQLDFVDPLHGWLMLQIDQGDALYRTTDGGVSWTLATSSHSTMAGQPVAPGTLPLTHSFGVDYKQHGCEFDPFSGVAFVDASNGFAAGSCAGPTATTYFYATHDGGSSWASVDLPPLATSPTCPCRASSTHPVFTSARSGSFAVDIDTIAVKCQPQNGGTSCSSNSVPNQALLYITNDGGRTWAGHPLPGVSAGYGPSFIDGRSGWLSAVATKPGGFPGETTVEGLYLTHDGGASWTPLATGGTFPGGRLDFISAREGWALPGAGDLPLTILHTRDGGRSWEKIFPSVDG